MAAVTPTFRSYFPAAGEQPPKRTAAIALLLGVSFCIGTTLILLNRDLMKVRGFRYPITLSGLGVAFAAVFSFASVRLGAVQLQEQTRELVQPSQWVTRCLPVGMCKAGSLMFGNWAYLHLNVGFIQMLNCFAPVIVMLTMRGFGIGELKKGVIPSVLAICCGTALCTTTDPSANPLGVFLIVAAIFCESIAIVLTQKMLQTSGLSVLEAQYVLAPAGTLALMTCAAATEWPKMVRSGHVSLFSKHPVMFGLAGVLGLCSNVVSFKVISVTSSLSLKILNMFRSVVLVFAGVMVLGEQVTRPELLGFAVSMGGFAGYNYFSTKKEQPKTPTELRLPEPPAGSTDDARPDGKE